MRREEAGDRVGRDEALCGANCDGFMWRWVGGLMRCWAVCYGLGMVARFGAPKKYYVIF
jgi:hypothetical protein